MKIEFFDGGYCYHPECVAIKSGSHKSVKFPAICALITHPTKGRILFDTGYSEHFFHATQKFPYSIYAKVTPVMVEEADKISQKLKKQGINSSDIDYVVLSHFHADHIGGLKEFTESKYLYTQSSYDILKDKTGLKALLKGFLPGLIPDNFVENSLPVNDSTLITKHYLCKYFTRVHDLFGDESLIGVEIPGHAKGQLGLYLETSTGPYFLIADACYFTETYKKMALPNEIVHIISDSKKEYIDTIKRINKISIDHPEINIVPSHCGEKFKELVKDIRWDTTDLNTCEI